MGHRGNLIGFINQYIQIIAKQFDRHIGSHSELTVHVTLDESAVRLGPRIEAELLRITQEAINNARRHSGGENLWVSCRVQPPYAEMSAARAVPAPAHAARQRTTASARRNDPTLTW